MKTVPTEKQVKTDWEAYQHSDNTRTERGLALGATLYNYRAGHKSTGGAGSKGTGLQELLDKLSIPHETAYRWIRRHEIGVLGKLPAKNQRSEYPGLEKQYDAGFAKVKAGEGSLSSFVREMDWEKSGRQSFGLSMTVNNAARRFLDFLSYPTALPLYRERREQIREENKPLFDEAWGIIRRVIYGVATDV